MVIGEGVYFHCIIMSNLGQIQTTNPKAHGLLGSFFFGEMKFVLSFFFNEDLGILYES